MGQNAAGAGNEAAGRMAVEVMSAALSERRRTPRFKFGVSGVVERSSTQPVKAIASDCGFPSLENFYRRYRRRYGQTPRGAG